MSISFHNVMSKHFTHKLLEELRKGLPGEASHAKMAPLNRPLSSFALKETDSVKESAVAVILFSRETSIHCLLIQRPEYEGAHSGQVAFPGGKKDLLDEHLEYTARRETWEEIGIPFSEGQLLGELTQVYIPVSGFLVKPYIYFHDELPSLQPNEREVAEVMSFNLEDLLKEDTISTFSIEIDKGVYRKNIPCFNLAEKQVWGATALILSELKDVLMRLSK